MSAFLTKSLGVVCPTCDFLNVVAAVRCMSCGNATDGSSAKTDQAPKLVPQPLQVQHEGSDKTVPMAKTPEAPPGLRRSQPAELGNTPAAPSSGRGVPARPTFQSSATPPPQAAPGPKFGLTVMAGPARGQRFRLGATGAQIGRAKGIILFPEDPFVSPLHATLTVRDGRLFLRDENSTSGIYASIAGQETVPAGGLFCTGLRLFRYVGAIEPAPAWNRADVLVYGAPVPNGVVHYSIEEVLLGDRAGRCVITPGPVLTIGQGRCDFSFPSDEGLAPRHCEVAPLPTGAMIRDLSGGLGTFVRITQERALKAGDRIRIGQQTLQVELLS
ncbi:MAG: FHA domain-containing protein [Myxococcaceae bacterium]|nr:FHA domain-containing protein [Myxococcaceae bacterium]